MQVVLFLLGTLVLSSSVLYVSADTEVYSKRLNLNNKKKNLFTEKKIADSILEKTGIKTFRNENLTAALKQMEVGRSNFFGLGLGQKLKKQCLSESNSFNTVRLNQLLTSNGLAPFTGTSTLTTTILNQLLLANGQLEIATLNQILQELGISQIPVSGNTLDLATQDRILEKLKTKTTPTGPDVTDFDTLNECLDFIGLQQVKGDGLLDRSGLISIVNVGGPLESDTLDSFLTCLRIQPDEPDPITEIDPTILSQILNALQIPNTCVAATSSTKLTIAAAVVTALGGLLAIAAPVLIGLLIGYLVKHKKGVVHDYDYYNDIVPTDIIPNLHIGYSASPVYVPPPTMNVPKTYGNPHMKYKA